MVETGEENRSFITDMSVRQFIQVLLGGAVIGALIGGLTLLLGAYLFKVMPCVADTCSAGGQYSAILAGIVGGAAGLFWLMKAQIFRPLLVVLAVTIALWGLALTIFDWPWYAVVLVSAGLHAAAYGFFAWISRIRLFWLVIVLTLLTIVGIRLILAS